MGLNAVIISLRYKTVRLRNIIPRIHLPVFQHPHMETYRNVKHKDYQPFYFLHFYQNSS